MPDATMSAISTCGAHGVLPSVPTVIFTPAADIFAEQRQHVCVHRHGCTYRARIRDAIAGARLAATDDVQTFDQAVGRGQEAILRIEPGETRGLGLRLHIVARILGVEHVEQ